ncbi:tyrosine-type recombinase/integrase [Nonomuraea sp. bgisy101]|uniref:tyrosine-type recombinase/integrase n=1 Tax=Nonomuraea sp. bgisy101 TaxID=3413784 RepID=UPI003D71A91C
MASIETRTNASGRTTYRVAWVAGGRRGGKRDSETCDSKTIARRFKALVESAGEHRPEGYPKGCRGLALAPAEPEPASELAPDAPTFAEVVERYLAQPNPKAEPRQLINYRRLFDRHVRTAIVTMEDGTRVGPLGGLPITAITSDVDQAWVDWMTKRRRPLRGEMVPYAPKTIHNVHGGVIAPALAYAARKGLLEANPSIGVRLPSKPGRTVTLDQVPTGEEIAEWIACAYSVSQLAGDMVALAFGTGLRFGELTALRPVDVDTRRKLLTVARAVKEEEEPRRMVIVAYGKTDSALRTIRIPESVVLMLRRHAKGLDAQELLFTAPKGGILHTNGWSRIWAKVVDVAQTRGITTDATLHDFRHAHATHLLAENVSLDTVSKRLGHKSIAVTSNLYSHLAPEADQRAADSIDRAMTGKLAAALEETA